MSEEGAIFKLDNLVVRIALTGLRLIGNEDSMGSLSAGNSRGI